MARYYRNAGARFPKGDGEWVGTGEVFRAEPDSRVVQQRLHKLEPVAHFDVPAEVSLGAVDFGSDAAREAAAEAGLSEFDFRGEGSGEGGAYLVSDVRELAGEG